MPIDPLTGAMIGAMVAHQGAQVFSKYPHTGVFAEKPGPYDHLPYATPEEHAERFAQWAAAQPDQQPPPGFVPPIFSDEEMERILQHDMHSNPAYAEEMGSLVRKAQHRGPDAVKPSRIYDNPEQIEAQSEDYQSRNRKSYLNPESGRVYSLGDSGLKYDMYHNPEVGRNYTLGAAGLQYLKKGGSVMTENGKLVAPWETDKEPTMLVVHISAGELEGLDALQGGPSIDEETGLREYSKLATIIEEPQIRDLFKTVFADLSDGDLSSPMEKAYQEAKQASLKYQDAPAEHTEPIEDIEKTGRHGDAHMALLPENLALFLVELEHHVSINPETGLLEFWSPKNFLRSVVRVAGTIGGAMIGGPIGAGLGNMAARAVTGQKPGMDMLMAGGKNALYAYGAQGLGQAAGLGTAGGAFGSGVGATGSTLGNMATQGFGPEAYGAYGSLMGKAAPAAAASVAAPAATAAGTVAAPAAAPAATGWMDKLTAVAPWAVMGLAMHGQKQHHGDRVKQWEYSQAEKERMREEGGFNIKPRKVKPAKYRANPDYKIGPERSSDQPMYIREGDTPEYNKGGKVSGHPIAHAELGSYNKGTLIKGPGNGQADKIRTRVPEGSYIIDASSVANFGDGSSESGGKVLKECEALIRRKALRKDPRKGKKPTKFGGMVDVFLSNDEYKFAPETVTLLGKGSNQKGSTILKSMVKNLRKDKIRNGDRLPPKAKHPMQYIMKGNSNHASN